MTMVQKLFSFQGRLRRRDFWLMVLLQWVLLMVYWVIITLIALAMGVPAEALTDDNATPTGPLLVLTLVNLVLSLALVVGLVWMGLAVQVKRCHDRNQSGWFVLFGIIPFFSLVNLGILDGTPGTNRFGPSPKNDVANAEVFA